MMRREG